MKTWYNRELEFIKEIQMGILELKNYLKLSSLHVFNSRLDTEENRKTLLKRRSLENIQTEAQVGEKNGKNRTDSKRCTGHRSFNT